MKQSGDITGTIKYVFSPATIHIILTKLTCINQRVMLKVIYVFPGQMQVFFCVWIGSFYLGQSIINIGKLMTATVTAVSIFETIDKVELCYTLANSLLL